MHNATFRTELDLDQDGAIGLKDLQIAVDQFGMGSIDYFLDKAPGVREEYDTSLILPHMIDSEIICGRCHAMDGAPDGMLAASGQENLCLSCHSSSKIAKGTPIANGAMGNSHPWGVMADAGDVAGPDGEGMFELGLHLDDGKIRCGSCHDPHELGDGNYLRDPRPADAMCKQCHRGEGAPIDHAIGLAHGPEHCTDCHDMHATGGQCGADQ